MAELAATFYQNLRSGVEKGEFPLTPVNIKTDMLKGVVMAVAGWRPLTRRTSHAQAYTLTMVAAHDAGVGLELHVDDPELITQSVTQCGEQCDRYLVTPESVKRYQHVGKIVSEFALQDVLRVTTGPQSGDMAQTRSDLFDAYMALVKPQPDADVFMPGQDPKFTEWIAGMNFEHVVNDPVLYQALYRLTYPE